MGIWKEDERVGECLPSTCQDSGNTGWWSKVSLGALLAFFTYFISLFSSVKWVVGRLNRNHAGKALNAVLGTWKTLNERKVWCSLYCSIWGNNCRGLEADTQRGHRPPPSPPSSITHYGG